MPEYRYICCACDKVLDVYQKMSDKKLKKCPACKKHKLDRVPFSPVIIMDSTKPKTVGDLADKNTEKLVSEGRIDKSHLNYGTNKRQMKKEKNKRNDLANLSKNQQERYIHTGNI